MVIKYIRKLLGVRSSIKADAAGETPAAAKGLTHQPEVHHRPIPRNLLDEDAARIVMRLVRFGHTAYIVGGGVRDLLLHRTPKDFDIGTSAKPNEIRKLFRNCRIIGRRFRLAHIYFHDKIIEVATFRSNEPEDLAAAATEEAAAALARRAGGASADKAPLLAEKAAREGGDLLIRSDNVFGTPETDALRRDFTINALFYDLETGNIIDYVGGVADLDARLLRTIGDPDVRMREDPIRILRATRLAGRLGFTIDPKTRAAIRTHKGDIRRAAAPRVLEDVLRMLRGSGAQGAFALLHELGIDQIVMPELISEAGPGDLDLQGKTLHSLDLATGRGTEFSNATLVALLFYPFVRRSLESSDADGGGPALAAIDRIVGGFEQRLIVPKRDRDRIRFILLAQRRFQPSHSGRRFSASAFILKPFFPEAFDLFDIVSSATGEGRDEVRRWKARIASVAASTDGAALGPAIVPHPGPRQEAHKGRHRRRRGGHGEARQGAEHSPQARSPVGADTGRRSTTATHEPLVLPELAPGENPYGDAIPVPVPSGSPRTPGHRPGPGHISSPPPGGPPTHADPATASTAAPGGRRRRRRGGRGRKRGGGGSGGPGGAAPGSSS